MLFFGISTITLNWAKVIPAVFFMVIGVEELVIGLVFRKLEDA